MHDYHITFDASSPSEFIWRIFDSKTRKVKIYTWWKPFDSGPGDFPYTLQAALDDALIAVGSEFAADVSGDSAINVEIHDPNLTMAVLNPIQEALLWVAQKGLGMAVSPDAFQP